MRHDSGEAPVLSSFRIALWNALTCTSMFRSLIAAQAAVPRGDMAVVTGVRNFLRLFGSTIALAVCATIVNNTLRSAVRPLNLTAAQVSSLVDDPTAINDPTKWTLGAADKAVIIAGYARGFRTVFYLTTACVLVAFIASLALVEQHELNRADDKALKEKNKELLRKKKMEKRRRKDIEAGSGLPDEKEVPAREEHNVDKQAKEDLDYDEKS